MHDSHVDQNPSPMHMHRIGSERIKREFPGEKSARSSLIECAWLLRALIFKMSFVAVCCINGISFPFHRGGDG
jgi:hypothetical protein